VLIHLKNYIVLVGSTLWKGLLSDTMFVLRARQIFQIGNEIGTMGM
jgi:hypothetical protein